MFMRFYRPDGSPYPDGEEGLQEWARDFANDELRILRQDRLPDGSRVSTVWLGLDHAPNLLDPLHTPLIFETMAFDKHGHILDTLRYPSPSDAITGHLQALARLHLRIAAECS
jgi:hypothetical protein